jgi:hypothetical protein
MWSSCDPDSSIPRYGRSQMNLVNYDHLALANQSHCLFSRLRHTGSARSREASVPDNPGEDCLQIEMWVQKVRRVRCRTSALPFVPIVLAARTFAQSCSNPGGIRRHVAVPGGLKPLTG